MPNVRHEQSGADRRSGRRRQIKSPEWIWRQSLKQKSAKVMSWYSKTSSDCHGSTPSRCGQIYRMAAGQDMPVLRPVPSPTSYPTLPILLVYRAACPAFIHSMAVTHPSLLSVHSQPTQYRRTCPLPATPKKECPCLVSSRHRSKRKRLKPDTRSREIRKRNPGIPNHRPKRQERCPKYTRSASLRSLLTTTLKSLPPGQPRWGRQLIKEEATSPQRRPAATRGTAGVAVRRRYQRGSGRTRGR